MKWEGNRESDNVEDRRGSGGGGGGGGIGGRGIGIGTIVIALIGGAVFGVNPLQVLDMLSGGGSGVGPGAQPTVQSTPATDKQTRFVRVVLADTEDVWSKLFKEKGAQYAPPKLVLFSGATRTECGTGQSASGPFYCPADQDVYIDLSFYTLMQERFGVSGEFAQAYVIAHEIGHHVQNQLGTSGKVHAARERGSEREANAMSVRLELQADCYAGVWAYHGNQARGILEQGDVESALKAAAAIGDDALQKQSQGRVVPDSFTHGTSEQRSRWFSKGLQSGQVEQCNTFDTRQL
jgi:predicted metalloprotease